MHVRSRAISVSLAGLLPAVLLGGCSSSAESGAGPSASSPASVPFQQGDIREVPDPRTLLAPEVQKELQIDPAEEGACAHEQADGAVDRWTCYLLTPPGSEDGDLAHISVDLHRPTADAKAGPSAAAHFADLKEDYADEGALTAAELGDEAVRTEDPLPADEDRVIFRVRNVTVRLEVVISPRIEDRRERAAEQQRRAWRMATGLAGSLTRLGD